MIALLCKSSIKYWRKHFSRFCVFQIAILMGVAALFSAAALMRSYKEEVLTHELNILGDYDLMVYEIDNNIYQAIIKMEEVEHIGAYWELGYAAPKDKSRKVKICCFEGLESADIYHMNCLKGRYPVRDDEIAVDIATAKMLGIIPQLDTKVKLSLFDMEGSVVGNKEYVIVGLFEATNQMVYGGWLRYPLKRPAGEYAMPAIFLSEKNRELFGECKRTSFLQLNTDDIDNVINELCVSFNIPYEQIETPLGRKFAYSYILGIVRSIFDKYGDMTFQNIKAAMKDQNIIKDFYSAILIPIFGVLVTFVTFVSVYGITHEIVNDRKKQIAAMRSMGLHAKTAGIYLVADFFACSGTGIVMGLVVGNGIHFLMIRSINKYFDLRLVSAYQTSEYVQNATENPFIYAILFSVLALLLGVIKPVYDVVSKTPAELLLNNKRGKYHNHKDRKMILHWKKLFKERIAFWDAGVFLMVIVVMGTMVFGYSYFLALSDKDAADLNYQKEENGLVLFDYMASKAERDTMYTFQIENGHCYGIPLQTYQLLREKEYVEYGEAQITNKSTRISFFDASEQEKEFLSDYSLRRFGNPKSSFEEELKNAEDAMISTIGYAMEEEIYSVPSVAMDRESIYKLEAFLVEGVIDYEALRKGDEVILFIPQHKLEQIPDCLRPGKRLPLSDIMLSEKEEGFEFSRMDFLKEQKPVYQKEVKNETGDILTVTSYAFGSRFDIQTNIGAIVTGEDELLLRFLPSLDEYMGEGKSNQYGVYVLCMDETFAHWGLRDVNYTEIRMKISEDAKLDQVDYEWYELLSNAEGISTSSGKEITDEIRIIRKRNMIIFVMMVALLFVMGTVAAAIAMYSRIRMKCRELVYLKAVGLRNRDICRVLLEMLIWYPVVGFLFSVLPIGFCHGFFIYIRYMVDHHIWVNTLGKPWYSEIPFRYDLIGSHTGNIMLFAFLLYYFTLLVALLPSLRYVSRLNVIDNLEQNRY